MLAFTQPGLGSVFLFLCSCLPRDCKTSLFAFLFLCVSRARSGPYPFGEPHLPAYQVSACALNLHAFVASQPLPHFGDSYTEAQFKRGIGIELLMVKSSWPLPCFLRQPLWHLRGPLGSGHIVLCITELDQ